MDGQPIGIDNIGFQITARELFEKCIIPPNLEVYESESSEFVSFEEEAISLREFVKDFNKFKG